MLNIFFHVVETIPWFLIRHNQIGIHNDAAQDQWQVDIFKREARMFIVESFDEALAVSYCVVVVAQCVAYGLVNQRETMLDSVLEQFVI